MKKFLGSIIVSAGLIGCNSDKISNSDIQVLIDNKQKSIEDILARSKELVQKHGIYEDQDELVEIMFDTHKKVLSFLDTLDNLNEAYIPYAAKGFINDTFYPEEIPFTEDTPASLIKLHIVYLENERLSWQADAIAQNETASGLHESALRFIKVSLVVIPDKIGFNETEKLTGTVALMGWPAKMKQTIFVNDKEVEPTEGEGHFAIDPKELKGQDSLRARIVLPDRTYSASIPIRRRR